MANRLAHSQSLYLRKHGANPIDWFPWGDEAIQKARQENKPIFLSIGYASCHWCTVMEHEAFSDTVIADYMNSHFVSIKVDREERPDLDSIYMQSVQIMGENGGWPLNLFLAPDDLVPFYGGTYFPIEPRYGRPGFLRVLQSILQIYHERRHDLQDYKRQIIQSLQQINRFNPVPVLSDRLLFDGISKCAEIVANRTYGTCFPMIPYADLVLRASRFERGYESMASVAHQGGHQNMSLPEPAAVNPQAATPSPKSLAEATALSQKVCQRGLSLVLGGIYDHVAGGWHRYTVDPTWTVPHFEKMLYDNGQIMEFLANLWAAGYHEPAFERAISQTATWLQREMLSADGYFYASQDADSEGKEGKFWVWHYDELKRIFSDSELRLLVDNFTITPQGNFEGSNVLQRKQPGVVAPAVEHLLYQLFQKRYGEFSRPTDAFPVAHSEADLRLIPWPGRVPPVTDTKMIVAWNSLMISGLAKAYKVFGQPIYRELAINAADFIYREQRVEGRLQRLNYGGVARESAQAEDYAYLIKALLDVADACPDVSHHYLEAAVSLQQEFDQYFWDALGGSYFNTAEDQSQNLLVRERSYQDNATPSANGVALCNLFRLVLLTHKLEYFDKAELSLKRFGLPMGQTPAACPTMLAALDWYYNSTLVRTTNEVHQVLRQYYYPVSVIQITEDLPSSDSLALVCQGFSCLEPATSLTQLYQQIHKSQTRFHD